MGGAAAAPHGAAAPMEERQRHVVLVCHRHQLLLQQHHALRMSGTAHHPSIRQPLAVHSQSCVSAACSQWLCAMTRVPKWKQG
jgi:hypothetical protein